MSQDASLCTVILIIAVVVVAVVLMCRDPKATKSAAVEFSKGNTETAAPQSAIAKSYSTRTALTSKVDMRSGHNIKQSTSAAMGCGVAPQCPSSVGTKILIEC